MDDQSQFLPLAGFGGKVEYYTITLLFKTIFKYLLERNGRFQQSNLFTVL